jgi:hypothetical protein
VPGSSKYPKALDDLPEDSASSTNAREGKPTGGPEGFHSGLHNDTSAALNAVQETLGTEPQADRENVADRLDGIEGAIEAGLGELPDNLALLEEDGKLVESQLPDSVVINSETAPTPQQYVHSGDVGLTPALKRLFEAGKTSAYLPPVAYDIAERLTLPHGMGLTFDPGTKLEATAAITGGMIVVGDLATKWQDKAIIGNGAVIECAGLADHGIDMPYFLNATIRDLTIRNPASTKGLVLGSSEAPGESNEHKLWGVKIDRDSSGAHVAVPAGSYGIHIARSSDGILDACTVVGAETSFRNDGSDNTFSHCHGWGWGGHLPKVIFDDNGFDNEYDGCKADTPSEFGYYVRQFNCTISQGKVFNNAAGTDNVMVGIHPVQASPFLSVSNVTFKGVDASHRIAKDYDGTLPNASVKSNGCQNTNTVLNFLTTDRTTVLQANSWFQPTGGGHIYSASGAPTISAVKGDVYFRTDTPSTASQRIYVCTEAGNHWTAIV